MNYEIPLVLFTACTQIAAGLSLFAAWRRPAGVAAAPPRLEWLLVWLLATAGLVFSLFHLGKPLLAATALKNLGAAWLSREGLIFALFAALAFLCLLFKAPKILGAATAAVGLLGILAQGMTYAAPAMPAIHNAWPLLWFGLSALVGGASLFLALGNGGPAARLLIWGGALLLLLLLGVPALWLGGDNLLVRESAERWFASPLYWGAALCLAAALLGAIRKMNAKLVFILCAAAVLLSRLVFFGATMHAAANIGGVY